MYTNRSFIEINEELEHKKAVEGLYEPKSLMLESILVHGSIPILANPTTFNRVQLTEYHGHLNDIKDYISCVKGFLQRNIEYTPKNKSYNLVMTENDFSDRSPKFFDRCRIIFDIAFGESEERNCDGEGAIQRKRDSKGNLYTYMEIHVFATEHNYPHLQYDVSTTVAHEITHAYDDYMRMSNNAKRLSQKSKESNYNLTVNLATFGKGLNPKNENEKQLTDEIERLGGFLYITYKPEVNAFISEVYTEMMEDDTPIQTLPDAVKVLEKTTAWQNFQNKESYVAHLETITDKRIQDALIKSFNAKFSKLKNDVVVKGKKYARTYREFVNYIRNIWRKYSKIYSKKLGKICYDVFNEKNDTAVFSHCNLIEWLI